MAEFTNLENMKIEDCSKIMMCVDESTNAEAAFQFYVEHFHKPETKIIFVHVAKIIIPSHVYASVMGVAIPAQPSHHGTDMERKRVMALGEKFNKLCEDVGVKNHSFLALMEGVEHGPGATIVEVAKKQNVKAIICGSRGLGAIRRTILGSVSDYVLHHSQVPTLICPKKT